MSSKISKMSSKIYINFSDLPRAPQKKPGQGESEKTAYSGDIDPLMAGLPPASSVRWFTTNPTIDVSKLGQIGTTD